MTVDWTAIRTEYEAGASLRQLERKYGVSKSVIGQRKHQEHWTEHKDTRTQGQTQEVVHPDINAAVRAARGFRMRFEQHMTWEEVAASAGYASRGAAHDAVMREARRHITQNIEEARDEERYRLEQLQKRCYEAATDRANDYWSFAIDRFVALSKRKSELMGLDIAKDANVAANMVVVREVPAGYLGEAKP